MPKHLFLSTLVHLLLLSIASQNDAWSLNTNTFKSYDKEKFRCIYVLSLSLFISLKNNEVLSFYLFLFLFTKWILNIICFIFTSIVVWLWWWYSPCYCCCNHHHHLCIYLSFSFFSRWRIKTLVNQSSSLFINHIKYISVYVLSSSTRIFLTKYHEKSLSSFSPFVLSHIGKKNCTVVVCTAFWHFIFFSLCY